MLRQSMSIVRQRTIVLRGRADQFIEEAERSLHSLIYLVGLFAMTMTFHFGRKAMSLTMMDNVGRAMDDKLIARSHGSKLPNECFDKPKIGTAFCLNFSSDVEMMKERFAKLLLGEDMSGGGKGVSSALTLSHAITNLAGV
ncbi:hypothetical protein IFM89_038821 [Coptis chinensis]|uniref:PRONE domain-containing protein n=1 Tax=Coptis chinensis TaxID=261450 RepID=A0A835LYA1_9MAGN|nr:hypothetical protein IFM89_038821 [Coptis chinensis]